MVVTHDPITAIGQGYSIFKKRMYVKSTSEGLS